MKRGMLRGVYGNNLSGINQGQKTGLISLRKERSLAKKAEEPNPNNDPYFENVVLLPYIDDTSFIDASSNAFVLTNNGVTISGSDIILSGGSNRISAPDNSKFYLGSSFTVEVWATPTTLDSNPRYIYSQVGNLANNSNRQCGLNVSSNNIQWYWTPNGASDSSVNFPCTLNANSLYHIAVSRVNNILYGFLNGTLLNSVSHTDIYFNSTADLSIGTFGKYAEDGFTQLSFIGKIKDGGLRITNGVGRYTTNFTPINPPFPNG